MRKLKRNSKLIYLAVALALVLAMALPLAVSADSFPQVGASNGGSNDSTVSHTVDLPDDIGDGDLLLVFFATKGTPDVQFPDAWTQLFSAPYGYDMQLVGYYRIADGNEGDSITVGTSHGIPSSYTSYRITGHLGAPVASTAADKSGTPDPPDLDPGWGEADILWFAVCGYTSDASVTAYPDGYTIHQRNDICTGDPSYDRSGVGSAGRQLKAAAENPGAFAISQSQYWVAATVAIQGAELEPTIPSVGGTAYPIGRLALMVPWITLLAVILAGTGLMVLRRRRAQN